MKLKLGSTLIFGFGGLLAIGLAYWQHTNWYLFALVPFVLWALIYSYEEINKLGWHYRLASWYFEDQLKSVCKVCPYWGLVATSVIFLIAQIVYGIIIQILLYIWFTFWWLAGLKPDWSVIAYGYFHGRTRYMFLRHPTKDHRGQPDTAMTWSRVWPIIFIGPPVLTLVALHVGAAQAGNFYRSVPLYLTVPATYVAMLALVGLGYLWTVTGWPVMKWAYDKGCSDAKFVEKVRVPANPELPPGTSASN